MKRIRKAFACILAVVAITAASLGLSSSPASATTGMLNWKVNYHGIHWSGFWDNAAGIARCSYSISIHQGLDGKAYAESYNFGYGIGSCTDEYNNGGGYDWYENGIALYRIRLDYRAASGTIFSAYSGWIGSTLDSFDGINQYILVHSNVVATPVKVCVEAQNFHAESGNYFWENPAAPYLDSACINY